MLVHIGEHFFLVLSSGSILIYGLYCAFLYDRHGEHEGRVTSYIAWQLVAKKTGKIREGKTNGQGLAQMHLCLQVKLDNMLGRKQRNNS